MTDAEKYAEATRLLRELQEAGYEINGLNRLSMAATGKVKVKATPKPVVKVEAKTELNPFRKAKDEGKE